MNRTLALFRSKPRDRAADEARIDRVSRAIEVAISEAEDELRILRARIRAEMDCAGFLFGADIESDVKGDIVAEGKLARCESNILRGEQRVRELTSHLSLLYSLQNILRVGHTTD
jgi:hypothetical protein